MKKKIVYILLLMIIFSCKSDFNKQYLLYRNFLAYKELNPVVMMKAIKHDKIKAIHLGYPGDTIIKNFLLFNKNGDLLSINRSQYRSDDLRFIEQFFYDKQGRLVKIIPKADYYSFWKPDSLIVKYQNGFPSKINVYRDNKLRGGINLKFARNYCEFTEYNNDSSYESINILDLYYFEKDNLMYEQHQKLEHVEFIKYIYNDSRLFQDYSPLDDYIIINEYDSLSRPTKKIIRDNITGKILWQDEYEYYQEDRFPNEVITKDPDGKLSKKGYLIEKY